MPDQNDFRAEFQCFCDDIGRRHRPKFTVQQVDLVFGIQQRAAERQQPERRKMLAGNAAADGWMGWVDEQNLHTLYYKVIDFVRSAMFKKSFKRGHAAAGGGETRSARAAAAAGRTTGAERVA